MSQIDRQKVEDIFNAALELPADRCAGFLHEACGDDAELREEIESLLASHKEDFLEENVSEKVLELICGSLPTGKIIKDRYKIIEMIAAGGMGEVYLAEDAKMKRKVALKVLPEKFSQDKRRLKNFEREARAVSQLNHQNILTIHNFIDEDGASFIITEFIEGETLRKKLQSKHLDVPTTLRITLDIASALEAAHKKGIVHRDIKPENIIINDDGHVKILDFGIAKLTEPESPDIEPDLPISSHTETASGFGTANYMSPEQVRRQDIDARSDIWSLGVCLYEMLTGNKAFSGKKRIDIYAAILKDEPDMPGPNIPTGLKDIVKKALHKNRDNRYQTIGEFRSDLEDLKLQPDKELPDSNNGMNTFKEWRKNSGQKIWQTFLYCIFFCFISSLGSTLYNSNLFNTVASQDEKIQAEERIKRGNEKRQEDPVTVEVQEMRRTKAARKVQAVASLFHLILIGIAFLYFYKNPGPEGFGPIENDIENGRLKQNITSSTGYKKIDDWKQARKIATRALINYREAFRWLLWAWVLLYFSLFLRYLLDTNASTDTNVITLVFTLFNNLNTLCIWLCFRILNEPISENNTPNSKGIIITEGSQGQIGWLLRPLVLMICWFAAEFGVYSFIRDAEFFHTLSKLVSGTLGGLVMALFIGRFQSKFLKSSKGLIAVLYLYTVIQILFIFFGDESARAEIWAAIVIFTALVLKTLLILYIFWLFQSGRLLFYLVRVRRASTQVDIEWQDFREVLQQER